MSAPFAEDALIASARNVDGLEDFGIAPFRPPLNVLLQDLARAPLNDMGVAILRSSVVHSLANRLRLQHWIEKHPEILEEQIRAPLVVIGMMRSGTTLVQRLLACDPQHTCTWGWEAMSPAPPPGSDPSATGDRLAGARKHEAQTREYAPTLFAIHPTYAEQAEEEIMFLADAFLSHVPEAYCDLPTYREWLNEQDFAPAYDHLYRMLQLLQWQKRLRGEHCGRWVLKSPAHLGYLELLLHTFPNAQIVHMHRDPVDTVASGASLNTNLWRMHMDAVTPSQVGAQWLQRMAWTNQRAMAFRDKNPNLASQFTDIRFDAATADPLAVISRIYAQIGTDFSDAAREAMQRWLKASKESGLAKHHYRAEEFGCTTEKIRSEFKDYYRRYLGAN